MLRQYLNKRLLIECYSWIGRKQLIFKLLVNRQSCSVVKRFATSTILLGACLLISPAQTTFAVGVGAAEAESFIGERLSVRIPLFNVVSPNTLQVTFDSSQFGGDNQAKVLSSLDRSNSQLAIRLSTEEPINEPYLNFSLDLVDGGAVLAKKFTVLLNLPPKGNIVLTDAIHFSSSSKVMGPYDTAIAGEIPQQFGAVLDGQSLWRVARRINSAMGVTRSQMMWALYKENPQAFTSDSVESLKAGVYLVIPAVEIVHAVSDAEAKSKLQALSRGELPAKNVSMSDNVVESNSISSPTDRSMVSKADLNQVEELVSASSGPFQVTSINQSAQNQSAIKGAGFTQSQSIIASLTETVESMSQQLERKDKKIEFLEEQVEELKTFIRDDVGANKLAPLPSSVVALNEVPELILTDSEHNAIFKQILPWVLLSLLVLLFAIYAFRQRIQNLMNDLNLLGSRDDMAFSVAEKEYFNNIMGVTNQSQSFNELMPKRAKSVEIEESVGSANKAIDSEGSFEESDSGLDFSESLDVSGAASESVMKINDQHDIDDFVFSKNDIKEVDFLNEPLGENEIVETIEILSDEISARKKEDLTFEEHFEHLLEQKDYGFARELLDFARYNEINDERYHFERLRMLERAGDEDSFYEYYYAIEDDISNFPARIQTQISQLVVQMAHI